MDPERYVRVEELLVFFAVSVLFFLGFYVLYYSGISLGTLTQLTAQMLEKMMAAAGSSGLTAFFASELRLVASSVFSLVLFSIGLSLLSVKSPGRLKYALVIPILLSGVLFNFSVLFLFFGAGLFAAALYTIPLGRTYSEELKKWKSFRIGSNAVGKALLVLSLFAFVGAYLELSGDTGYAGDFRESLIESVSVIVMGELGNMASVQNMSAAGNSVDVESLVRSSLEESPLISGLVVWFPLVMSFTIFASLELLRSLLLSPLAGVFSLFWLFILKRTLDKNGGGFFGVPRTEESSKSPENPKPSKISETSPPSPPSEAEKDPKPPEVAEIEALMAELEKEEEGNVQNSSKSAS